MAAAPAWRRLSESVKKENENKLKSQLHHL
jgi:hypothetical protein